MKTKIFLILCAGLILISLLSSCRSQPNSFRLENMISTASLSAKTVFLDIPMAEWKRGKLPFLSAPIYNAGLKKIISEYSSLEKQRVTVLQGQLAEYYSDLYNTEFAYDSYNEYKPFEVKRNLGLIRFIDPDQKTRQAIADICAKHEAEYALAIYGEMITYGYDTFGTTGNTQLFFSMVLFDKSGNIATKGSAGAGYGYEGTRPYWVKSKDVQKFISMFDDAANSLKSLISSIGR